MNYSPNGGNRELHIKRAWPILINIIQIKDIYGYINQFHTIPKFNTDDIPPDFKWSLFAIVYGCKDLWHIFYTKKIYFYMEWMVRMDFDFDSIFFHFDISW